MVPELRLQTYNNMWYLCLCFCVGLLLGVSAQEWDGAAANFVHARKRGEAEEPDWLHHLHDQCSPL